MKPRRSSRFPSLLILGFSALGLSNALATSWYWDADGATTTATGGTGSWTQAGVLWRSGSATGTLTAYNDAAGPQNDTTANLVLAGGLDTGVMTLISSTSYNLNKITTSNTYTFATDTATATFVGTTPTVDVASGKSLVWGIDLSAASATVTKSGTGTWQWNSATGQVTSNTTTLDITAGTLQFNTSAASANLFTGTGGIVKANSGSIVSLLQTNNGAYTTAKSWTLGSKLTLNGGSLNGGSSNGGQFQRLTSTTAVQVDAASTISQSSGGFSQNFTIEGTFTGTGALALNRAASNNRYLNLKGSMSGYSGNVTIDASTATGYVLFGNSTGWGTGNLSLSGAGSKVIIGDEVATVYNSAWTGGSALLFTSGTLAPAGAITLSSGSELGLMNATGNAILFSPVNGLTVNGGTLSLNGSAGTSAFVPAATSSWIFGGSAVSTVSGKVQLNNTGATFQVADAVAGSAVDTLVSGAVSGSNGFTKTGAGTIRLSANNSYSGATVANAGRLELTGTNASSVSISDGAIFRGTGSTTGSFTLGSSTGATIAVNPAASGAFTVVDLTLTGSNALTFDSIPAASGVYDLFTYSGSLTGSVANLTSNYRGSFADTAGTISFTSALGALTWSGAIDNVWNLKSTANWTSPGSDVFYTFDSVTFDDSGANRNVSLSGALVADQVTVNNTTGNDYSFEGPGTLTGTSALTKSGTGILTISNANTFTGGTTFTDGRIRIGSTTAFGTGSVFVSSGSLSSDGATARSIGNAISIGTALTLGDAVDNGNLTLSGIVSGSGLTKVGSGTLTLTGTNTYSGTTVSAGSVIATVSTTQNSIGAGSASIATSTSLQLNNTNTSATTVTIANTFTGAGLLKLNFAASTTNARGTTMSGMGGFTGTIQLSNAGATADKWSVGGVSASGASVIVDSGSQLYLTGSAATFSSVSITGTGNSEIRGAIRLANTLNAPLSLSGDATIGTEGGTVNGAVTSGASGTQTLTLGSTNSTGNATFSGIIGGGTGTLAISKTAAGNATFSAANTYSGGTSLSAGTLTLGNASALGSGALTITGGGLDSSVANLVNSQNNAQNWNGNFSFTGTENLDLGTGAVAMNAARTVTVTAKNLSVGGVISGPAFSLTKLGAGTLTLTNSNTYSGGTLIGTSTTTVAGVVVITTPSALGSGTVTIPKAGTVSGTLALQLTGTNTITNTFGAFNSGTSMAGGGSAHIRNVSGDNTINSVLSLTGTGGNGIIVESVAGAGNLLTLAGNITTTQASRTHFFGGTGDGIISGSIQNAASIAKEGTGKWTLTGTNTHTGSNAINAGILALGSGIQALGGSGTVASVGSISFGGGTLQFSAVNTTDYSSRFSVAADMAYRLDTNGQSVNWGTGRTPTGTGSMTKLGAGTLSITTSVNRWTGATTINGGTLNATTIAGINTDSSIGKGSITGSAADLVIAGGILQHTAANVATSDRLFTIGNATGLNATLDSSSASATDTVSFTNPAALEYGGSGTRILTLTGSNTGANTLAPIIGDGTGGSTSLVKSGDGTWILTGTNTYTGTTTVNGGTLGGIGAASSIFTVQSGATLSPGASIGTMSTAGTTFANGSTFKVEINTTTATADKLVSTGAVSIGTTTLSLSNLGTGTLAGGTKLTLIDYTGGSLSGIFIGYAEGAPVVVGTKNFTISYVDSSKVTLTAVATGYASWAADNANNDAANLDTDHDGVPNGVEYFMGQTGSSFTANPAPVGNTVTWPKDPTATASYVVQTSSTLKDEVTPGDGGWITAPSGVTDNGTSVVYVIPSGDPKRFTRLKVTIP